MTRTLFLFLFISLFTSRVAASEAVTAELLQGEWTRTMMNQADSCTPPEEYVPPMPPDNKWIIKGDSISLYSYPVTFLARYKFSIEADSLFISTAYRVQQLYWRKSFYALIHYEAGVLTLSMPECITMKFRRDTFSAETARLLQVLDRDTLNPGEEIHDEDTFRAR
jgi:hypothetical protein